MSYDRTLLYSGTVGVSSCTLSEPASDFESIKIGFGPAYQNEIRIINNWTNIHVPRWGSTYNDQAYLNWPYKIMVTDGRKNITVSSQQLLLQEGTKIGTFTNGITGNSANNIKLIHYVYGINRKNKIEELGKGSPSYGWTEYNETLLWSATDATAQKASAINLAQPANTFERLKIGVGSHNNSECSNYLEVNSPATTTAWMNLESWWGTTDAPGCCFHRYRFSGYDTLIPTSGKGYNLTTASNYPYTAVGNYASTDRYIRYPVFQVWGINKKV